MTAFLTLPDGRGIDRAAGLMPRLVGYSFEDRAAKGLRKFSDTTEGPQRAQYFSVPEAVSMMPALLLHGPRGSGRSTLARAFADPPGDWLTRAVIRNPEGDLIAQVWETGTPRVFVAIPADAGQTFSAAMATDGPVLLILDGLPEAADDLLLKATRWAVDTPDARLLVLVESAQLDHIRRPPELPSYRLLPLPAPARARMLAPFGVTDPHAADWIDPGPFALGLAAGRPVDLAALARSGADCPAWMADHRAAAALEREPATVIASRVAADPVVLRPALAHLAAWWGPEARDAEALVSAMIAATVSPNLLLALEPLVVPGQPLADRVAGAIAASVAVGGIPSSLRRGAGEALSRLGDPRVVDDLVTVPAGTYLMGGELHPNSMPRHRVTLPAFRIARHPVTVAAYGRFADATGRAWASPARRDPARQNHPATDLTWHDARAYCDWLTAEWRRDNRLPAHEVFRLPTEREWEAAARGAVGFDWPWGNAWAPDHCNGDEAGLNDTCAVGLFPEGNAPSGAADMAGNIWEWCTTLWGRDMAAPTYTYPWTDDGREALDASGDIRRVLRGGCFSSPGYKSNGIYRGSLEPGGSWRGNGFRIVAARMS